MPLDYLVTALITVLPFAFSLVLLSIVRKTEIFCRESWHNVLFAFLYGATMAVFLALIVSEILSILLQSLGLAPALLSLVGIVVIAPVVEESSKSTGVIAMRPKLTEVENGIVYGSAVGLGFSATENFLYFYNAYYLAGIEVLITIIILRFLTSTFLHLGATGVTGYGIGISNVKRLLGGKVPSWAPFLFAAMGLHALFNFLSLVPSFFGDTSLPQANTIILLVEIAMVWLLFSVLRERIRKLDRTAGCALEGSPPTANQYERSKT